MSRTMPSNPALWPERGGSERTRSKAKATGRKKRAPTNVAGTRLISDRMGRDPGLTRRDVEQTLTAAEGSHIDFTPDRTI